MTETVQQICDLCGNSDFEIISNKDRHNNELTTGLCQHCGLVMHLPVPSEEEIAAYYADDYRRDYHGESKPSSRRVMRAWNNGQRILGQVKQYIPQSGHVFEVGAGIGCTVKSFEADGFNASGIEPNTGFNSYTHDVLHAEVGNINLYDLQASHAYDVVLLIHVIEHFTSPTRALKKIRELLKDNALLYVECPNIAAPFATFGRMFHFAHIYNFTPNTLITLAKVAGYEVAEVFTSAYHPDIQILFRKVEIPNHVELSKQEASHTRKRIFHYHWLTYNLRSAYLLRRIQKLLSYAKEYMHANAFVKNLEKRFKV